jgi:hypothetical protein
MAEKKTMSCFCCHKMSLKSQVYYESLWIQFNSHGQKRWVYGWLTNQLNQFSRFSLCKSSRSQITNLLSQALGDEMKF